MSQQIWLVLELRLDHDPDGFAAVLKAGADDEAIRRLWRGQLLYPWMVGHIASSIMVKYLTRPTSWLIPAMRNTLVSIYVCVGLALSSPVLFLSPEIGLWPRGITMAACSFFLVMLWGRLGRDAMASSPDFGRGCMVYIIALIAMFPIAAGGDSLVQRIAEHQPALFTLVFLSLAAWQVRHEYSADVWRRRLEGDAASDVKHKDRGTDESVDGNDAHRSESLDETIVLAPRAFTLRSVLMLARLSKEGRLRDASGMLLRFLLILIITFVLRIIGIPGGWIFTFMTGFILIILGPPPKPPLSSPLPRTERAPLIFWATITFSVAVVGLCLGAMHLVEAVVQGAGWGRTIGGGQNPDIVLFIASLLAILPLAIWLPRPLNRLRWMTPRRDGIDPIEVIATAGVFFTASWISGMADGSAAAQESIGSMTLVAALALVIWPISYAGLRRFYLASDLRE